MIRASLALLAVLGQFAAPAVLGQSGVRHGDLDPADAQWTSAGVPLDGPARPTPIFTQLDIEGGRYTLQELRRRGLELFTTSFNKYDGHGDGPVGPDPREFGQRPTTNGTWLRANGLDAQTCQECHGVLSNATVPPTLGLAGVAGISASAMPGVTRFDIQDNNATGIAEVNGRLINPPFLFGAGGVELAGKEMTAELQALAELAVANPGMVVALVAKGVSFGSIVYDEETGLDTSQVEGVDEDLVVRPFGRKGEFSSIRQFDIGALQFHFGMQAIELVGEGIDDDGDGVVNEMMPGELTAMHLFGVTLERPRQVALDDPDVHRGRRAFDSIGCGSCHVPFLDTGTPDLPIAFPEIGEDPFANVFMTVDLSAGPGFQPNTSGGVRVPLFSDLKRHNMGPLLSETTGSHLDEHFITPRLWGVSDTAPYLHDGRALTLREAILAHGGEGQFAADAFDGLDATTQERLLTFLDSLRVPRHPARGIDEPVRRRR